MTNRVFSLAILVAASAALLFICPASDAADWPMWRHDAGRSAATDEQLPAELHLQWSRQFPPLTPAWPEDPRLHFDAHYEPIVLGDTMFVASSRNDSVTAIDTTTGAEKWRFYAEGPVRLAPVATNGKVYFGADDGNFYCLSASNGTLQWKLRAAPTDRRAIGNERLISIWPQRGGAVLADDKIYCTVGVWPFEGTMLYAIDLGSSDGRAVPEYKVTPLDNFAPQGHLAASDGKLFIPGGRSNIYCRDLQTGKQVSLKYDAKGTTDYHVMASAKWMFHGGKVVDAETRAMLPFVVNRPVIDDGKVYFSSKGKAYAYDLANQQEIEKKDRQGKTVKTKVPTPLWQFSAQPVSKVHLKTAKRLYAHYGNTVFAIDIPSRDEKATVPFTATIEGTPSSMLAADGKLFVVTAQGSIHCFGEGSQPPKNYAIDEPVVAAVGDERWPTRLKAILDTTEARSGYCLALGIGTGQLIEELAQQTQFHLIAVDPDAAKVDAFRRRLDANGLYGTRIVAHVGDPLAFDFPPYLASLVVSESSTELAENPSFAQRVFHVLRPYGGAVCLELPEAAHNSLAN